MRDHTTYF